MPAPAASERLPTLALLAGGLATRLRPRTLKLPKSMIEVAGRPFIAHQLRLLAGQGIRDIVVCAGYMGDQIEAYIADGTGFGCRVRYSFDGDKLLGTGGALRHALPLLSEQFFVMYGDSYLPTPFVLPLYAFQRAKLPALMTVFRNAGRWDTSNVEFVDGEIRRYDKVDRTPEMLHIDYGLGIVDASVLRNWTGDDAFDLAKLYSGLARQGRLAGFEVHDRFYEIGSPAGISETDAYLRRLPN
jgi:NDP-sugar pyrophosphorylase family protein